MAESTVTSPDGKEFVVTHPEGATPEQIIGYAKANMPAAESKPNTLGNNPVTRVGADVIYKNTAGLAGAVADIPFALGEMAHKYVGKPIGVPDLPNPKPSAMIRKVLPPPPPPQGFGEKLAAETIGGAALGGGTGVIGAAGKVAQAMKGGAVAGAGAGAGGELAADAFGDHPVARIVGALVGGPAGMLTAKGVEFIKSLLGGSSMRTPGVVHEAAKNIPDETFARAKADQASARDIGVNVTGAQAMPQPTPLLGLQNKVATSPSTSSVANAMFNRQTSQSTDAGRALLDKIAPAGDPTQAAFKAQTAAEGSVERARQLRTKVTKPEFAFTEKNMARQDAFDANQEMREILKEVGPNTPAGRFIESNVAVHIGETKLSPQGNLSFTETDLERLKNILAGAKTKLSSPTIADEGVDRHTAAQIRSLLAPFEKKIDTYRVNSEAGKTLYKQISDDIVDPMKRSPTGAIAGKKGVVEDTPTATSRILKVLDDDSNIRAQSILRTSRDLSKSDPKAFPALVRATWERKLESALKGEEGHIDPQAPATFASSVWGSAGQTAKRENFRAMVAGVAEAHGLRAPEVAEAVKGAEKVMQAIEMAGRGRSAIGTAAGTPGAGGETMLTDVVRIKGATPFSATARHIQNIFEAKSNKEIMELLTSKDGLEKIRQFARTNPADWRQAGFAGGAAATVNQVRPPQDR